MRERNAIVHARVCRRQEDGRPQYELRKTFLRGSWSFSMKEQK